MTPSDTTFFNMSLNDNGGLVLGNVYQYAPTGELELGPWTTTLHTGSTQFNGQLEYWSMDSQSSDEGNAPTPPSVLAEPPTFEDPPQSNSLSENLKTEVPDNDKERLASPRKMISQRVKQRFRCDRPECAWMKEMKHSALLEVSVHHVSRRPRESNIYKTTAAPQQPRWCSSYVAFVIMFKAAIANRSYPAAYLCEHCHKGFTKSGNLKRHLSTCKIKKESTVKQDDYGRHDQY